jgi:hypothetical protein
MPLGTRFFWMYVTSSGHGTTSDQMRESSLGAGGTYTGRERCSASRRLATPGLFRYSFTKMASAVFAWYTPAELRTADRFIWYRFKRDLGTWWATRRGFF